MGAKILLHFSRDTLANFPSIINGYTNSPKLEESQVETITALNPLKSMEENFCSLEEISSTAS